MKKLLFITLFSAVLVGCSAPAALNFTPNELQPVQPTQKINAEIKTINVSVATKEEQKGELQVGFLGNEYEQSFKSTLKSSLEESLARTAIFKDDAPTKLTLIAKVLKFESPGSGVNFDTNMIMKYSFIDCNTGGTIYDTEVSSFGSVPFNYAFAGFVRATEARNRAVKENITKLIEDLKQHKFK